MPKSVNASARPRFVVAAAIARACGDFPDIGPVALDAEGLSPADRALATAIHRTTLQRWLTLEHLLNRVSKQPMAKLEPAMRAVLLTGAAQLLFMPGVAAYAAVDESVKVAAKLVRPQARAMVNAVLRKIAALPADFAADEPWTPGRDRLPLDGGTLHLHEPALPRPDNLVKHLVAATSHPEALVNRWVKHFGARQTIDLCLHGLRTPPTILVADPPIDRDDAQPHEREGFAVWNGDYAGLRTVLAEAPRTRRVQDPASFAACAAAADLEPAAILDYCAGLGTKTRQLALMHPTATIVATDVDAARRAALAELPAMYPNIEVVDPDEALTRRCDLLLLDAPCSNSGVLARRPEARYRFSEQSLADLATLQRNIIERTLPTATGHVLYTTCSIEPEENQRQAAWIVERTGGELIRQETILPAGQGPSHHDGSYHALVRL